MSGDSKALLRQSSLYWVATLLGLLGSISPAFAQCDPPLPPFPPPGDGVLLYSLNGQSVEANELGDFFISNVAAPDVFPADFVGDDYLFLTGTKLTGGSFVTISLSGALGFTHPANGLPLVPPGYVDLLNNIERLQDIRSGDIILLSNYSKKHRNAIAPAEEGDPQGRDGGYYFGGQLHGWHGSLYDTDMTIPIVFSFPHGEGVPISAFLQTVNGVLPAPPSSARIVDMNRAIHIVLTGEEMP